MRRLFKRLVRGLFPAPHILMTAATALLGGQPFSPRRAQLQTIFYRQLPKSASVIQIARNRDSSVSPPLIFHFNRRKSRSMRSSMTGDRWALYRYRWWRLTLQLMDTTPAPAHTPDQLSSLGLHSPLRLRLRPQRWPSALFGDVEALPPRLQRSKVTRTPLIARGV